MQKTQVRATLCFCSHFSSPPGTHYLELARRTKSLTPSLRTHTGMLLSDCVGSDQYRFLDSFIQKRKGAALLVGPPGTGKTLLTQLLLEKHGFSPVVMDCSIVKIQVPKYGEAAKKINQSLRNELLKGIGAHSTFPGTKPVAFVVDNVIGSYSDGHERHAEVLKIITQLLLRDDNNLVIVISDERATPTIRKLPITTMISFYRPTRLQLHGCAVRLNGNRAYGFSDSQLWDAVNASTDYRAVRFNLELLALHPTGDLRVGDTTASNIFRAGRELFCTKLSPMQRSNYEDAVDSNPYLYTNMIHENYPKAVISKSHFRDLSRGELVGQMEETSMMADCLSDVDLFSEHFEMDWKTDRVGANIGNTYLIQTSQMTNQRERGSGKLEMTFCRKAFAGTSYRKDQFGRGLTPLDQGLGVGEDNQGRRKTYSKFPHAVARTNTYSKQ
jgi:hypothetical protein